MFKVGQRVRDEWYGEGVVTHTDTYEIYQVYVDFDNGEWDSYTEDGRLYENDDKPSLFVIEE